MAYPIMAYPMLRNIVAPVIIKLWLRDVGGIENIPKDKPFIAAANHTSYLEALILPSILILQTDKKLYSWVNSTYWKNPITRFFLDLWGAIPVYVNKEKNSREKNKDAFKKALAYMEERNIMLLFPEGTRSKDGKLGKAYNGIARLAFASRVPIIPIGVIGANKVMPKGKKFPRFARCEVKIGKPVYFEKYYGKRINNKILEDITRQIMRHIAKLIGQKYTY